MQQTASFVCSLTHRSRYKHGAGMAGVTLAAGFSKGNMRGGISYRNTVLTAVLLLI